MSPPSNSDAAPATAATAALPPAWQLRLRGLRVRARIGAEKIRVDLAGGFGRLALPPPREFELGPRQASLTQAAEGLGLALGALQSATGPLKGLACDVVVADHWMLYDVVRTDLHGMSPQAADDLIGAALADVAGVQPGELATRWQAQGDRQSTLACGLPADALLAIGEALRGQGLRPGAIEGEFVREYNTVRRGLQLDRSVIALVREAGTQLAIGIDGVLGAMSFELGVRAPEELAIRGRGLLRCAGVGQEDSIRYYAILPEGWRPPAPWQAATPGGAVPAATASASGAARAA